MSNITDLTHKRSRGVQLGTWTWCEGEEMEPSSFRGSSKMAVASFFQWKTARVSSKMLRLHHACAFCYSATYLPTLPSLYYLQLASYSKKSDFFFVGEKFRCWSRVHSQRLNWSDESWTYEDRCYLCWYVFSYGTVRASSIYALKCAAKQPAANVDYIAARWLADA